MKIENACGMLIEEMLESDRIAMTVGAVGYDFVRWPNGGWVPCGSGLFAGITKPFSDDEVAGLLDRADAIIVQPDVSKPLAFIITEEEES